MNFHALQNQHVDLVTSRSRCTTREQFERFQSRVEGHANSIQGEVASALGFRADTLEISRRIIVGAVAGNQPEPGTLEGILEEQYATLEDVTALIDSTIKSCGRAAVWKAIGARCDETSLLDHCATGDPGCKACEP